MTSLPNPPSEDLLNRLEAWSVGELSQNDEVELGHELDLREDREQLRELFGPMNDIELRSVRPPLPQATNGARRWLMGGGLSAAAGWLLYVGLQSPPVELRIAGVPDEPVRAGQAVRVAITPSRQVASVTVYPSDRPSQLISLQQRPGEGYILLQKAAALVGHRYGRREVTIVAGDPSCGVSQSPPMHHDGCAVAKFTIDVRPPPMRLAVLMEDRTPHLGTPEPLPTTVVDDDAQLTIVAQPSSPNVASTQLEGLPARLERWLGHVWEPLGPAREQPQWSLTTARLFNGLTTCTVRVRLFAPDLPGDDAVLGALEIRRQPCPGGSQ